MSLPDQEARALRLVEEFLYDLVTGREKRIPSVTRERARRVLKHYPLGAEVRWLLAEQKRHDADAPQQARITKALDDRYPEETP